jgi:hypothetical protein
MKFSCKTTINLSRKRVVELFINSENLKHWQDGFISFKQLEEPLRHVGSKSIMRYMIKGKPMDITETITTNKLPEELSGLYESPHMDNTMQNFFNEISSKQTEYISVIEHTRFNGFWVKVMASLFPNMFKKQVQKWMDQFKNLAENTDK